MAATTGASNAAAWLDAPGQPFVVREAPMPIPTPHEVVLKVHAVAINPADAARQRTGMYIAQSAYPYVIGCDGAGTIASVGNDVKNFRPGDRVTVASDEFKLQKADHGMFQRYVVVASQNVAKIPDSLSFEDAAVLPLGISTACGMLFEKESLNLDWPTTDATIRTQRNHDNEIVIVWGGSSSVGASAIQLLKLAGYRTIGIASKHNFDLVRDAGAEEVFDHNDANCVENVCKWVESKNPNLGGVLSCTPMGKGANERCGEIARRLPGNKFVSTAFPRNVPAMPLPDLGEGIKVGGCFAIVEEDLLKYIWGEWMAKALELRQLKCLPSPDVVGQGLDAISGACEVMAKGVSGKKLVVNGI